MTARLPLLIAALALAAPAPAGAIVNGTPDGDDHPYVAIVGAGDVFCTASLVSPTVLVTAGHCTAIFADIGGPVYATFDEHPDADSEYVARHAVHDARLLRRAAAGHRPARPRSPTTSA